MQTSHKKARILWILALAMLLNFFLSTYIMLQEFATSSNNSPLNGDSCFINSTTAGGNCFKVQSSQYSSLLGVPIAGWGMIIFLFMTIALGALAESVKHNSPIPYYERKHFEKLISFSFILALFFALWFIYAQLFLIKSICRYCFIIDVVTILSAFLSFITFKRD